MTTRPIFVQFRRLLCVHVKREIEALKELCVRAGVTEEEIQNCSPQSTLIIYLFIYLFIMKIVQHTQKVKQKPRTKQYVTTVAYVSFFWRKLKSFFKSSSAFP